MRTGLWNPKVWKPRYDIVIMLHVAGLNTNEVARMCKLSPQHVSNITRSPIGREMIFEAQERMRRGLAVSIEDEILVLAAEGIGRLGETIRAEFDPAAAGKRHQDNVSFGMLKMAGYGPNSEGNGKKDGQPLFSDEVGKQLVSALDRTTGRGEIKDAEFSVEPAEDVEEED